MQSSKTDESSDFVDRFKEFDIRMRRSRVATLQSLVDVVAELYPDSVVIGEEFPEMHCGIPRRFWARIWAAIRMTEAENFATYIGSGDLPKALT